MDGALAVGALVSLGRSIMQEGEESVAEWTEVWTDSEGRYRLSATPECRVRLWADSRSSVVTLLPAFEVQEGHKPARGHPTLRGCDGLGLDSESDR